MARIAVIISQIEESCQARIWDGIVAEALANSVELVTFTAFSLDSDDQIKSHYAMLQSFISDSAFDGVILFTGAMSEYTPWPTVKRYAESIHLPLVTISGSTGCGSNIVVNNRSGIVEQVTHLAEQHRRRKIAFIGGPESNAEAAERYDAFREALKLNSLDFDERLVQPGTFSEESGEDGIENLLKSSCEFDGVICVDDYTAIGAIRALNHNGIHVPRDVSVVGFDDIAEASMCSPSLTTIQQPFYLLGTSALETVLAMIQNKNETTEDTVMLNTHGVNRSSCGCTSEEVRLFRENWHAERSLLGRDSLKQFMSQIEPLLAHLMMEMHLPYEIKSPYHQFLVDSTIMLWNSFFNEIESHKTNTSLLEILNDILNENMEFTLDFTVWQCILSNLTPFAFHFEDRPQQLLAGAILHEARVALDARDKHAIQMQAFENRSQGEAIRESCTKIITAVSQEELVHAVKDAFEEHGFTHAALVVFNHYSPILWKEWHLPSVLYTQFEIIDGEVFIPSSLDGQQFSSTSFIPPRLRSSCDGKSMIFMPLYMNNEYFGYFLFEPIPCAPKELYSEVQVHTACAYKSCFMMDNLRALSMNDELTGLSNRRGFMLLTHQLQARATNSGKDLLFFFFDLDNLKKINDTYSHEDGDRAIKAAASLLRRTFRNHDIIGRIGGDEFVAVIEESVPGLERIMSNRLYELIATYNTHSGYPYAVEMSIGTYPLRITGTDTIDDALREADRAMFENKRERKKGRDSHL